MGLDYVESDVQMRNILAYWLKKLFSTCQKLGFHILPCTCYSPIPNTRALKDNLWNNESELVGVDMKEKEQLELLSLFATKFKSEYEKFPRNKTHKPHEYYVNNGCFGHVDGEILYCMIRHFRPLRIIEIGSGNSTLLAAQAILKNKQEDNCYECELITIDPYPNETLKRGFLGLSKLIVENVENIPLSEFQKLDENDILFIDSSHVLKIGSDVQYEYLEILPRLKKGVIIHSHDILFPKEYHRKWILEDHYFWNEQYLLQSFLAFNSNFKVLWCASYMHIRHPDKLERAFNSYSREERWPVSFWMRRIK